MHRRPILAFVFATAVALGILPRARAVGAPEFYALTNFIAFTGNTNPTNGLIFLDSPRGKSVAPWNELLLSWNASTPEESGLEFQAQAVFPERNSAWYSLGAWSEETNAFSRHSLGKQKDADGEVDTDILRLKAPAEGFRIRVILHPAKSGRVPELRLLTVSLIDTHSTNPPVASPPGLRNKILNVPQRTQHAYAGGISWCSPTSLSMVLQYWADRLGRPEIGHDVPEVVAGVYDPGWHGTGNWPFNVAYAGRFQPLRAYAARLRDLADVEAWISKDVPVVISVSLNLVRGKPAQEGDGHLIVVVGFNETGDVWVNDPDASYPPVPGRTIRRLYSRQDVERGWAISHRTAYVIQDGSLPLEWTPRP